MKKSLWMESKMWPLIGEKVRKRVPVFSPGVGFLKDPVTHRARKAILETMIRLLWKATLFCFRYIRKGKITAKFQMLNRVLVEDAKGFTPPEKFRAVGETGPWACAIPKCTLRTQWYAPKRKLIPVAVLLPQSTGRYRFIRGESKWNYTWN